MATVLSLATRSRFLENACNSSKYFNSEGEFDDKARDADVDKLYQEYVPVMVGVAESVQEVHSWPLDKYIVMTGLSNKILEARQSQEAGAVTKGIVDFWNEIHKK